MPAEIPTLSDIEQLLRKVVREELGREGRAVLSTEDAARLAGVTPKTVRAWVEEGRLQAGRRGRKLSIRREDLDAFLAGDRAPRGPADDLVASLGPSR